MERTFKGSLFTLGGMFLAMAIMFGLGVATPENSPIYNVALGTVVALMCSSPVVMLVAIISGVGSLINRTQGNQGKSKRKREFDTFTYNNNDAVLEDIMEQLSPEQQAYLERRLQNSSMGVGNDGELISIDDLLSDYDQEQRENRM
ncbi:MAG: hypothetical protein AAF846_11875 [Chloroflexota bacterium]